ncbi:MAG: PLP-dependent aminotransferase family protein, partial [Anaerolineales bacterium]|nr:PLP-dependent aminotransferase family protein [Anaerolineales bacterium]
GPAAMQYASTLGFQPLREWIAQRTPPAKAKNVLLINGSQQAIDLVGRLFLEPGDKVVVSAPTYTTALSTFRVYDVEFLGVAGDENGMLPDQLEAALQQSPKLIYAIPNFMNPSGVSMNLERRQTLVQLAEQYDVPILEDDPYGELRFDGEPLPNLFELAPDRVLYAGTFSKIVAPGFRIGWMVVPDEIFEPLMIAKQSTDLQASTYAQ